MIWAPAVFQAEPCADHSMSTGSSCGHDAVAVAEFVVAAVEVTDDDDAEFTAATTLCRWR